MKARPFLVVIEKGKRNYSAFLPDLPGCVASGRTKRQTLALLRQCIVLHLKGMKEDGDPIPRPTCSAATVLIPPPPRKRRAAST